MADLFLHACCGPCSTVAVPAWQARGERLVTWFSNPNIQPGIEHRRRREAMRSYAAAAGIELRVAGRAAAEDAWQRWTAALIEQPAEDRCRACIGLRLDEAAAEARAAGIERFSTTLSVSPYQRHDLIAAAGAAAAQKHGGEFVYLDLRPGFRRQYDECRRLGLYRQKYCGCAASKWEAWHQRRAGKHS